MASCGDMKKNEVYVCECCGLELEVKKECNCPEDDHCETGKTDGVCCDFQCCGSTMSKK